MEADGQDAFLDEAGARLIVMLRALERPTDPGARGRVAREARILAAASAARGLPSVAAAAATIEAAFRLAPDPEQSAPARRAVEVVLEALPILWRANGMLDDATRALGTAAGVVGDPAPAASPSPTPSPTSDPPSVRAPNTDADNSSAQILVVDDSALMRATLRDPLAARGWDVIEAVDGESGIAAARAHQPDVILCDLQMPGLDGYGVLAAVQNEPLLAETPLLFLTSRDKGDDIAEGLERGAHDYLCKPVDSAELVARVRAALRTKRLRDELRRQHLALEQLARVDALTGVLNRRAAVERLSGAVTGASRHHHQLSVVMLDIDRFKSINDEFGHATGDAVLRGVAERLQATLRHEDSIGRWGGEEFLLILPDVDAPGAVVAAERVRDALRAAPLADVSVTASFGVAELAGDTGDELVARADAAMYRAKIAGRDRVVAATERRAAATAR